MLQFGIIDYEIFSNREIKERLEKDEMMTNPGSGTEWMNQINALRDVNLRLHGEKKALGRAFMLASAGRYIS